MNAPMLSQPIGLRTANLSDPLERARIGTFVYEHREGTPFHLPAWSVAVEKGCGQKSHYLVAEKANGEIVGVMPLTHCQSPLFGSVLASAGFGVGGGILADSPHAVAALASASWALAEKLGCGSMEVRGGPLPGPEWEAESERYQGFVRPLAADDDAELLAIPRKQRAEVRKVLDGGLTVTTGRDASERRDHYRIYATSVRNLGTPVFPKKLFDAVLDAFGDGADILTVRRNGKPVASVLSLYWRGTVMPYWGGGTADARRLRANELMYFALMRHARAKGCTRFDFGRSKIGTGPYSYKKNWGFEPQLLVYARWLAQGETPRDTNPNSAKYRLQVDLWKKLPLWAANRIGPLIARGLG